MNTIEFRRRLQGIFIPVMLGAAPQWSIAQASARATPDPQEEALYTMGLNLGQQLHQNGVAAEVPVDRIEQGIKDGLAGKKALASDQMRVQAFLRSSAAAAAASNAAAAQEFLKRNASEPGVTAMASGLQYKVLAAGNPNGASPHPTDLVTLSFRGTLLDGTEFDRSTRPGTASTVQANGVIKGWAEALSLMRPGDRWQLYVPPELGYGLTSRAGVPGGSLLIFDLQLISIAGPLTK